MNVELLVTFIILNIVNVIMQTVKSIATVKCGKAAAAGINALAYGLYTIVTVYMLCELPLFWKAGIVALCNLVGVFIVKWAEEIARKDKMWKVEFTVTNQKENVIETILKNGGISYSYIKLDNKHTVFNCYCATQKDSLLVKTIVEKFHAKYFVSESKVL